jgi:hypothetical protein
MAKSASGSSQPTDFELCDHTFARILDYHGDDVDASALSEAARVVLLVWHVAGIVDNGGFRALFEGHLKGDPHFALTAAAFRTVGCKKAAEAVRKTLAMFPKSRPPADIDERLRHYLTRLKKWPADADAQFWDAGDDLRRCLARYIRLHAQDLGYLETPRPNVATPKSGKARLAKPKSAKPAAKRRKTGPSVEDLPRWARVVFAARCANQVLPVFDGHWPRVPPKRRKALLRAIEMAEESAAQGRAVEGLKDAVMHAVMTAGAALACFYDSRLKSRPKNAYSGTIASLASKAAEKAGEAARTRGKDSEFAAWEAWDFAVNAARSAKATDIVEKLREDLIRLHRAAVRSKWSDRTPIPRDIWVDAQLTGAE